PPSRGITTLAAVSHAIVASASRPHFMECLQQKQTLSRLVPGDVRSDAPALAEVQRSPRDRWLFLGGPLRTVPRVCVPPGSERRDGRWPTAQAARRASPTCPALFPHSALRPAGARDNDACCRQLRLRKQLWGGRPIGYGTA